ncbi:autotransporter outer membrane beta-barrel domain-containing protein [Avibacterium sp. 21-599]|uniref:autotransporter outer membrane beta-barrel domain-containing protein n=1 Tax=Avibacterium sp. 21-599 TaxID=2911528 RepID=UPI002245C694|nr:autotransporter outer membrane beta-barrel domain-containing protein [Avibacterium sp. 21-599]MCW9718736.1 autotransporter outer membrane beta-barrel domain-containing protein [Avibacterium sp. 21-599]
MKKQLKLLPLAIAVSAGLYGLPVVSVAASCTSTLNTTQVVEGGKAAYSNQACVNVADGNAIEINAKGNDKSKEKEYQGQILIRSDIAAENGSALLLKENVTLRYNLFVGGADKASIKEASLVGRVGIDFQGSEYHGYDKESDRNGILILDGNLVKGSEAAIKIKNGPNGSYDLPIRSYAGKIDGNILVENPGSKKVIVYLFPASLTANQDKYNNILHSEIIKGVALIKNQDNSKLIIQTGDNGSNWNEAEFVSLAKNALNFETKSSALEKSLLKVAKADIKNNEIIVKLTDLVNSDNKLDALSLSGGSQIEFVLLDTQNGVSVNDNVVKLVNSNGQTLDILESSSDFGYDHMQLVTNGSKTTSKVEGNQYKVTYAYEGGSRLDINAPAGQSAELTKSALDKINAQTDLKSINNNGNLIIDLANGEQIDWKNLTFNSKTADDTLAFKLSGVDKDKPANFSDAFLSVGKVNIENSTVTLQLSDYIYDENSSNTVLKAFDKKQLLNLVDKDNSNVALATVKVLDQNGQSLSDPKTTELAENISSTHKNGALTLSSEDYRFGYTDESYELTLDNTAGGAVPHLTTALQAGMEGKNYTAVTNKGDAIIDVPSSGVNLGNAVFTSGNTAGELTLQVAEKAIESALLTADSINVANGQLILKFTQDGVTTDDITDKEYVLFSADNGVSVSTDVANIDLVNKNGESLLQKTDEIYAPEGSWQVANHKAGKLLNTEPTNRTQYKVRYQAGDVEFLAPQSRDAFKALLPTSQQSFVGYILEKRLDGLGGQADSLIRSARTNDEARQLANQMMPDLSGAEINAALVWSEQMRSHIEQRTLAYRHQLPSYEREDGWNLWANTSFAHGKNSSDYGYSLNRYGVHIGMDRQINDEALIGFSVGANRNNISPDTGSIEKKITQLTFMPYFEWKGEDYFAGANLIGGTYSVDSERKIGNTTATGDYSGFQVGYQLTTGIDTELKGLHLRPFVSLKHQWFSNSGWKETGSPFALSADTQTYSARHIGGGVSLWKRFDLEIGKFVPSFDVQYYRQFGGSDYDVNYRLSDDTTTPTQGKFTIGGVAGTQFSTKLNARLDITENLNISSSLSYNKFGNYKETAFGLGISNTF